MREILFRGKQVDNGEWVQGDFVSSGCGIAYTDYLNEHGDIGEVFCKVIPETVGQYTGLTDKNGNKVFEGDIVYVCYEGKNGAIVFKHGMYLIDGNGFCIDFILTDRGEELEIIGNIHDNPELLKGGDENA